MPTTALLAAGIGAGGQVLGAGIGALAQIYSSSNAMNALQQYLSEGYSYANNMFGNVSNALTPFISNGQQALTTYENALPGLTQPFSAATLPSTPGYQFTLGQGLKSTQNSYAAQGLADSGAALKGAASYATGLAQNTYNQQFQNYLAQNSQIANLLYQPVQTGANAAGTYAGVAGELGAAGLGAATGTGQGIANLLTGQGNAIAGAATGSANALTGGINTALQYSLLSNLYNNISAANSPLTGIAMGFNPYLTGAISTNPGLGSAMPGAAAYMNGYMG